MCRLLAPDCGGIAHLFLNPAIPTHCCEWFQVACQLSDVDRLHQAMDKICFSLAPFKRTNIHRKDKIPGLTVAELVQGGSSFSWCGEPTCILRGQFRDLCSWMEMQLDGNAHSLSESQHAVWHPSLLFWVSKLNNRRQGSSTHVGLKMKNKIIFSIKILFYLSTL